MFLKLEAALEPAKFIKMDHTLIVDNMAYVGQLKHAELIYQEFSTKLLKSVLNTVWIMYIVYRVNNVYKENPIKDLGRARRLSQDLAIKRFVPNSKIKQWQMLLPSSDFKNKLVLYLV